MSADEGVTRSMEATAARAAARVERARRALPSGWWAMALLVCTEATLFGSLIATYFYLRFQAPVWPPPGVPDPSVAEPLALTGGLLVSALPMAGAVRAANLGRVRAAWILIAVALAIQATYLGLQIHLYASDLGSFSPTDTAYGSIYFTLLAIHHAHVAIGLAFDLWLLGKLLGGFTKYRVVAVRVIALYWYFVALVGVAVVFTQIYPSLW
jgi:heme/copper-type cytochrome/quinol oxidase subunit 3